MAKKQKTLTKLKKDLDTVFSQYIRLRRAINEECTCVTCGVTNHYKKMQNGHFMSRRHASTRWDEENCQVQCYSCNVMQQGKQYEYSIWLDSFYGQGKADELLAKSRITTKFDRYDLEEMIKKYKEKVNNLSS